MALHPVPLSLYIHVPWCIQKCPYCDFNSHGIKGGTVPAVQYVDALIEDFKQQTARLHGRSIGTVFFGGGTPSLLPANEVGRLLVALKQQADFAENAEITLEANPGAVDQSQFAPLLEAGVNRLSIGVQSFDAGSLQKIGRVHSVDQAHQAISAAQIAGFERINCDLMFGLPGQSLAMAEFDVDTALATGISHLSLYQLTLEPNTAFFHAPPVLPDDDIKFAMQQSLQRRIQSAGFEQYEVSAYARPRQASRHNLNYWQFGDYLAIGAGAHGKISTAASDQTGLQIQRYWQIKHPKAYMAAMNTGSFEQGANVVPENEHALEFLMNGLRLKQGVALDLITQRTAVSSAELLQQLAPAFDQSLLCLHQDRVQATELGYLWLDDILQTLLPASNEPKSPLPPITLGAA